MIKRPQFLASLAALCAAPFVTTTAKPKPKAGDITFAGRIIEPYIIRKSYRMSAEEYRICSGSSRGAFLREEWIVDQFVKEMVLEIKRNPNLRKATIMNPHGSVEYHYILQL